jgi:hypothetical protein
MWCGACCVEPIVFHNDHTQPKTDIMRRKNNLSRQWSLVNEKHYGNHTHTWLQSHLHTRIVCLESCCCFSPQMKTPS